MLLAIAAISVRRRPMVRVLFALLAMQYAMQLIAAVHRGAAEELTIRVIVTIRISS
jgi:hypothetical protein